MSNGPSITSIRCCAINLTPTPTPSITPTSTPGATPTSTQTPTPTNTITPTNTSTPTSTSTPTPTNTITPTNTSTPGITPSSTATPTPTNTATPTSTVTPTNTQTATNTATPTNTITPTSTFTPTPTNTATPTNTITPTNTTTQTPTPSSNPSYANWNSQADWDSSNGNVTTVGTNGAPSAYGTYDQTGNLSEWFDLDNIAGEVGIRGGSWFDAGSQIHKSYRRVENNIGGGSSYGYRIATINNELNLSYFSTINDINNTNDSTGYGSVSYSYKIAQYMTTNCEYVEFLNAIASTDTYGVYDTQMAGSRGGINRSGSSGSYSYSVKENYANKPVNWVSWANAARYCNWLHNNKPSGPQNSSTTENGAYTLNGLISGSVGVKKNIGAKYYIPTENEWYKAGYYKSGSTNAGYWAYATQSNNVPIAVNALSNGDGTINNITPLNNTLYSCKDLLVLVYDTNKQTSNNTITFPVNGSSPNIVVDWGDSSSNRYNTVGNKTHTYSVDGIYNVSIAGYMASFNYGDTNSNDLNKLKLVKCLSFGNIGIINIDTAFKNCLNINQIPATVPSSITGVRDLLYGSNTFNGSEISSWNISNFTSLNGMFSLATGFNQNIGSWQTSSITSMIGTFSGATSFNQNISSWNVSSVVSMSNMFNNATSFNQNLSGWNIIGLNSSSSLNNFMSNVTLSSTNYDSLLIYWNSNKASYRSDLVPNFGSSKYSTAAVPARSGLIAYGWVITDGGPV